MKTLTSLLNSLKLSDQKELKMKNILDLLDESDYELDLKIAEVFEGENLFTIYLLMIHELTFGELKYVGFKNFACERIIKAIISSQNLEKPNYPILYIFKYFFELIKIIDLKKVQKVFSKLKIEKYEILELINSDHLKLIDVRYFLDRILGIYENGQRTTLHFGLRLMILEKDIKDNDTLSENSIGILTEIMRRNSRWFSSRFFIKVEGAKEYLEQFKNIIKNQKVINWTEINTLFVKNNDPEHPLKYILERPAISDKQVLEPTYLRYVYDGLSKGALSSSDAAGLPFGFIGLFEKEFQAHIPSNERSELLRRLGVCALFQGPVSAKMLSAILDEHIDETKALIDRFTKWFNTPEPGKYVLYHDRLRTYLLQKLSDFEVNELNETLIEFLENSIGESGGSEAELYALEHLSFHMTVESELDKNYERLHNFVKREDIWQRQIKTTIEYKWSKKSIQYGIKEGARRHNEMNTLISSVNSVRLFKEEQNSTQQILDLLNKGDYQTSLRRTFSFEGEKLCTIYLLMIHELTVGISKDADYKVEACKAILEAINEDENWAIPSFYPEIALFQYHLELKKIDELFFDKPKEYVDENTGEFIAEYSKYKYFKQEFLTQFHSIIEKDGDYIPNIICTTYQHEETFNWEGRIPFFIGIKNYIDFDFQKFNPVQIYPSLQIIFEASLFDEINGYIELSKNYFKIEPSASFQSFINVKTGEQITSAKEAGLLCLSYAVEKIMNFSESDSNNPELSDERNLDNYLSKKSDYLISVSKILLSQGEKEQIIEILERAINLISRIGDAPLGGEDPRPYNYLQIFNIFFELKEISRCIQIAEKITKGWYEKIQNIDPKAQCYIKILYHFYENNKIDEYNNVFNKLTHYSNTSEPVTVSTKFNIARVHLNNSEILFRRKDVKGALKIIKDVDSISSGVSFENYSQLKKNILHLLFKNNQTDKALEISKNYYDFLKKLQTKSSNFSIREIFMLSHILFTYNENNYANEYFGEAIITNYNKSDKNVSNIRGSQDILLNISKDFIEIDRVDLIYKIIRETDIAQYSIWRNPIETICYWLLDYNFIHDALKISAEHEIDLTKIRNKSVKSYKASLESIDLESLVSICKKNNYKDSNFLKYVLCKICDTNDLDRLKSIIIESLNINLINTPYFSDNSDTRLNLRMMNNLNKKILKYLINKCGKTNIQNCFSTIDKFEYLINKNENKITTEGNISFSEISFFNDNKHHFTQFISKIKIDLLFYNLNDFIEDSLSNKNIIKHIFDLVDAILPLNYDLQKRKGQKCAAYMDVAVRFRDKGYKDEALMAINKSLKLESSSVHPEKIYILYTLFTINERFNIKSISEIVNEIKEMSISLGKKDESWLYIEIGEILSRNDEIIEALKLIYFDLKKLIETKPDDIFIEFDRESCFEDIVTFLKNIAILKNNQNQESLLIDPNYYYESIGSIGISSELYKKSILKECQQLMTENYSNHYNKKEDINRVHETNKYENVSEVTVTDFNLLIKSSLDNGEMAILNHIYKDKRNRYVIDTEKTIEIHNYELDDIIQKLTNQGIQEVRDVGSVPLSVPEYVYFNKFNEQYKWLINLLFYKAKIACFFEDEQDEEKLNLLSQAIDIDEWRKVSASI